MHNNNNEQFDSEVEESQLQPPGIMLRKVRRERGLSEEEVCKQLGLTSRIFRALESDDFERLPAPPYVRGYIRNYTTLLDIPADDVLMSFETFYREVMGAGEQAELISPQKVMLWKRRIFWLTLAVVIAVLSMILLWVFSGTTEASEVTNDLKSSALSTASVQHSLVAEAESDNQLTMAFAAGSWAEVVDANQDILLAEMVQAGEQRVLQGVAPFQVRLSEPDGVKIHYAGQPIQVKSLPSTQAGNVIVTR